MSSKPISFSVPSPPKESLLNINNFTGINLNITPTQIADNESPDMLNMYITDSGRLEKRTGYDKMFLSLGNGNINGMYEYKDTFLFAFGTKLYKLKDTQAVVKCGGIGVIVGTFKVGEQFYEYELIYDGLADHRITFFEYNGLCYIMDGTNYKVYNGTTVTDVVGYVPTLYIASAPAGGGTQFEQFNLLSNSFKQSFTANGTATLYQLALSGLDTGLVTIWIDEVQHNENDVSPIFTVDRANGKITFATPPVIGLPDNVIIQASKTTTGLTDRIKKCTDFVVFGGINDTHVIFYGNPDTPSVMYRSGVIDPTYFPENYYQAVGNTSEKIQKMIIQYSACICIKENSVWYIDFELNTSGEATYPVRPVNDSIGCCNPSTVQLIDNAPVYMNKKGMYAISPSTTLATVRTEKNVNRISDRVNKLLTTDTILASIDYDNKLILSGTKCYIYDYKNNAWFIWDNVPAVCFIEYNKELYFGDANGTIHRFKVKDVDRFPYVDNGLAINAYWKSKPYGMGAEERNKLIQKLFVTLAPYKHTSANFYYVTEMVSMPRNQDNLPNYANMMYSKSFYNDKIFDAKSEFIDTVRVEILDYDNLDYSYFSYYAEVYPTEFVMKVKAKKIVYYQFVVQNYKINENIGVDGFVLKYYVQNYRK